MLISWSKFGLFIKLSVIKYFIVTRIGMNCILVAEKMSLPRLNVNAVTVNWFMKDDTKGVFYFSVTRLVTYNLRQFINRLDYAQSICDCKDWKVTFVKPFDRVSFCLCPSFLHIIDGWVGVNNSSRQFICLYEDMLEQVWGLCI